MKSNISLDTKFENDMRHILGYKFQDSLIKTIVGENGTEFMITLDDHVIFEVLLLLDCLDIKVLLLAILNYLQKTRGISYYIHSLVV